MSLTNLSLKSEISPRLPHGYAAEYLSKLNNELLSTARMWAADEIGATIAHELSEPLTALLFYLHEIEQDDAQSPVVDADPGSRKNMVAQALRETTRLCAIIEHLQHRQDASKDANVTTIHSQDSSDWLGQSVVVGGPTSDSIEPFQRPLLTRREREVLHLITTGITNKAGGHALGISTRTFEAHRAHLMAKFGARNGADLVRLALSKG